MADIEAQSDRKKRGPFKPSEQILKLINDELTLHEVPLKRRKAAANRVYRKKLYRIDSIFQAITDLIFLLQCMKRDEELNKKFEADIKELCEEGINRVVFEILYEKMPPSNMIDFRVQVAYSLLQSLISKIIHCYEEDYQPLLKEDAKRFETWASIVAKTIPVQQPRKDARRISIHEPEKYGLKFAQVDDSNETSKSR